ncbi:MAG: hypothetical protein COV44_09380 [Deltaproteobacteria bacterium CG11_big_fil_rev_8_21_14_0_20_45_16]|nr:MAG: hypothetical protein COV44_09380 [Deltaproteobacteria bacterium CG11_big_fil_rev_8_21_14_0_20_45_16]
MKQIYGRQIFMALLVLVLSACEDPFVGNRAFNIENLNAPYTMKKVTIASTEYLVLTNTNRLAQQNDGSLQFYNLSAPRSPVLDADLSFKIPSNVVDFYIEEGVSEPRVFLLDRNENRLLVYGLSAGSFSPVVGPDGQPLRIALYSNPISIEGFSFDGRDYLAVAVMNVSTMQFISRDDLRVLTESDLEALVGDLGVDAANVTDYRKDRLENVSSFMEMRPRLKLGSTTQLQEIKNISGSERQGRGIGKILYLGGATADILGISFSDTAAFGFRFSAFDNNSNLLWDLSAAQNGVTGVAGTKEEGFRGAALDGLGNLYLSSRSDNKIYAVPPSVWALDREPDGQARNTERRNTHTVFGGVTPISGQPTTEAYLNVRKIDVDFDEDDSDADTVTGDAKFPRLSDLVVNNQTGASAATRAWVIGLESKDRGYNQSRIYAVDLDSPQILDVEVFNAGDSPQKLLYLDGSSLVYVSFLNGDRLDIYDVSGDQLDLVGQIENQ